MISMLMIAASWLARHLKCGGSGTTCAHVAHTVEAIHHVAAIMH